MGRAFKNTFYLFVIVSISTASAARADGCRGTNFGPGGPPTYPMGLYQNSAGASLRVGAHDCSQLTVSSYANATVHQDINETIIADGRERDVPALLTASMFLRQIPLASARYTARFADASLPPLMVTWQGLLVVRGGLASSRVSGTGQAQLVIRNEIPPHGVLIDGGGQTVQHCPAGSVIQSRSIAVRAHVDSMPSGAQQRFFLAAINQRRRGEGLATVSSIPHDFSDTYYEVHEYSAPLTSGYHWGPVARCVPGAASSGGSGSEAGTAAE